MKSQFLLVALISSCGWGACRPAQGLEDQVEGTPADAGPGRDAGDTITAADAGADAGSNSPAGSDCSDEALEGDSTLQQAAAAPPRAHIYGQGPLRLEGKVACPSDEDWIHAYGDCCHEAGAVVRWEAPAGPLDVELFDEEGRPLPLSAPGDVVLRQPGEVRLLRAGHGGHFFVRIRSAQPLPVPYSVDLFAPVSVR